MHRLLPLLVLFACEGPTGPVGPERPPGINGSVGATGSAGPKGDPADPSPWIVGPGVDVAISDLTFDAAGAHVAFTLADATGTPLDRTGHLTEGKVDVSFVLAQLDQQTDGSPGSYTAYTTRTQTSPITSNSATQAIDESTGTFEVVDVTQGSYRYTFASSVASLVAARTQTAAALAIRTFDHVQAIDRATFSTIPAGGTPIVRDEVTEATCDGCHRVLPGHEGRWTAPAQCVLCHQPQSSDPDTGNTLDFRVMVHRIHRGRDLPSVIAGTPYRLVGDGQVVNDFSSIEFPQNIQRCETCHAGAQGDRWQTQPAMAACGSCHDNISFAVTPPAGTIAHQGGPQSTDASCQICHPATTGLAPIVQKHYTDLLDPATPVLAVQIQSITNTAPGQIPTLTFKVTANGAPRDLSAAPLTSLTATLAGPNTDIATAWQAKIQAASGAVGTLAAVDAPNGVFAYTFPATAVCTSPMNLVSSTLQSCAIPPSATGSYSVGVEGTLQVTATARPVVFAQPLAFAVTDAVAQPRRTIVDGNNCNGCHRELVGHGSRKNPQYCVFCHNPNKANDQRSARFESSSIVAPPVDFRVMIHKIHMGEELAGPYVLGAFPLPTAANPAGTPVDFGAVRYPRTRTDCNACHAAKNWTLPMTNSVAYLPSTQLQMTCTEVPGNDTNAFCDNPFWTIAQITKIPPQTSVCTSCHDAPYTAAHAELNTTPSGVEACATCHGAGMDWDVEKFHGL